MSTIKKIRILGIDPGFERVGIAVVEKSGEKKDTLLYSNCFKTSSKLPFNIRLRMIGIEIERIIKEYKPEYLAIEKLYLTTNHKTVMGVSEARGVLVYVASSKNLQIFEYTPPQIKIAVTGYGKADKKMVTSMVLKLIDIKKETSSDDELDAIAICITCLAHEKLHLH
jgi:crossover junction endodeoxyribonuclease RuvC